MEKLIEEYESAHLARCQACIKHWKLIDPHFMFPTRASLSALNSAREEFENAAVAEKNSRLALFPNWTGCMKEWSAFERSLQS